ncbi:MAG: murein transglycosylase A [Rhodocyclaceae bacterium]|nr:murein transglycosylase A [Rhodocyclaceae bacterium]
MPLAIHPPVCRNTNITHILARARPQAARLAANVTILLALSGCASGPPSQPAATAMGSANMATVCPAPATVSGMTCPVCPTCPVIPQEPPFIDITATSTTPEVPRGRLEKSSWDGLRDWSNDDTGDALTAFEQGCPILRDRPEWQHVCVRASALVAAKFDRATAANFFRENFQPFRVINADETASGMVTGYYEPLLKGSRTRTNVFKYPIYAKPPDLITVDLADVYADLKFRRLRGRLVDNKLVPYYDRAEIESAKAPLKGLELVWVDNAVELFFLQIQGSGQVQLPDGSRIRLGYADQNGHPFRSLGGALIRRGEIKPERASMQGIKAWAERNPRKLHHFMHTNPSYVFFKEIDAGGTGPIGTLGVPLTAERSIAVDPRVIPLGVPVFLSTTFPGTNQPLNRLMVAQDTGGAIAGAVRVDFFWGFGDDAGAQAGRMKQRGEKWVLLPNGYDPNGANNSTVPK